MKLSIPLSFLLSLFSFARDTRVVTSKLIKVNSDKVREHIKFITSTSKARSYENLKVLDEVADYITKRFKEETDQVQIIPFNISSGTEYKNIVVSFGPMNAPRFIIGAHYDVAGDQPGADDNASGVAALLEIARMLKEGQHKLEHRIDLVAFAIEEPPFFGTSDMGSAHYAKYLHKEKIKVKMMLALDMIGFFSTKPDSQQRPPPLRAIYPSVGDFIAVVGNFKQVRATRRVKSLMIKGGEGLKVESVNAPSFIPGVDFSDHRNFWDYGFPGLMITDTAFYRNPNYHQSSDTMETLDFENMGKVIQALYYLAIHF